MDFYQHNRARYLEDKQGQHSPFLNAIAVYRLLSKLRQAIKMAAWTRAFCRVFLKVLFQKIICMPKNYGKVVRV